MITWPIPHGFAKLVLKFPDRDFFTTTQSLQIALRGPRSFLAETLLTKKCDIILFLLEKMTGSPTESLTLTLERKRL
jgi:hypothetical protein